MACPVTELLGETVVSKDDKVAVSTLAGRDKVIGLYFSAHWCPPCRGFTPVLAEFYQTFKDSPKGGQFEIIFVSSDKDDASFKDYFESMPWLALDFADRSRKNALSKKFKIQGIPALILLDGETGKVITSDGRSVVTDDPQGLGFPWNPKPFSELIKGELLRNAEDKVDAGTALAGKIIGLYFSAHWCPPCKAFTPELIKIYNLLREQGKNFEVVFLSSDRNDESFVEYYKSMPWMAVPLNDERKNQLSRRYSVEGIPCLVILDEDGNTITMNGRSAVNADKDGKDFPWHRKPLRQLTEQVAAELNEAASLILFTSGEEEAMNSAKNTLQDLAEAEAQKGDDQGLFFYYAGEDDIVDSVRDFAKLADTTPMMIILDILEQKVYPCEAENVTKETAAAFIKEYHEGTLTSRFLR